MATAHYLRVQFCKQRRMNGVSRRSRRVYRTKTSETRFCSQKWESSRNVLASCSVPGALKRLSTARSWKANGKIAWPCTPLLLFYCCFLPFLPESNLFRVCRVHTIFYPFSSHSLLGNCRKKIPPKPFSRNHWEISSAPLFLSIELVQELTLAHKTASSQNYTN